MEATREQAAWVAGHDAARAAEHLTHVHETLLNGVPVYYVRCERGCELGTSAVDGTREGAQWRADLHVSIQRTRGGAR